MNHDRAATSAPPAATAMAAVSAVRNADHDMARALLRGLPDEEALRRAADFLALLVGEAMHLWGTTDPAGPDEWWRDLALRVAALEGDPDA